MGPTELLPGSHHLFQLHQYMAHYARIRGSFGGPVRPLKSSSRTMRLARRSRSTSPQVRNLLKFWYLRTTSPRRDWIRCSDFTLEEAFHLPGGNSFGGESHLVRNQSVEMMYWLAGEHDVFGPSFPSSNLPVYYFGDGARPSAV